MAAAPSFTAGTSLDPPPKRPMGVRAPSTMTDEVMASSFRMGSRRRSNPFYDPLAGRSLRDGVRLLVGNGHRVHRGQVHHGPTVGPALAALAHGAPDDLEDVLPHQL